MVLTKIVIAATTFVASFLGTRLLVRTLLARAILDHPNDRSSHAVPTPVGGGLVIIGVIAVEWLIVWALSALENDAQFTYPIPLLIGVTLVLGAVSWRDDRRPLSPVLRLLVQAVAVLIGVAALSAHGRIFQAVLPYGLDIVVTAWVWLWVINLTNFMDGIDGITGVEGGSVGVGVALLAPLAAAAGLTLDLVPQDNLALYALVLAAALAGFTWWNWQPARIFLGDVGSVPLGFLLGWMLLELAGSGLWAAALLLPLYYLMDATLTLLHRIARRERLMEAHRRHFYQRAARRLGSHARVSTVILALNVVLIALAYASARQPEIQGALLALGVVLTAAVLWYFARDAAPIPDRPPMP
ncbi:MAG: glycosyltransferase family 4 protein [Alphaproteobacteria bacterium]|nr:glycosyltransferase family 4 protein [Alphaproteobacteria bacterium]